MYFICNFYAKFFVCAISNYINKLSLFLEYPFSYLSKILNFYPKNWNIFKIIEFSQAELALSSYSLHLISVYRNILICLF